MSTEITAWLDEAQEKVDDATPGPWATDLRLDGRAWVDVPGIDGRAFGLHGFPDDAAFIADARTRLPQAIAALRAAMEVHGALDAAQYVGRGKSIRRQVCTGCGTDDGNWAIWPCATVRAIAAALGVQP